MKKTTVVLTGTIAPTQNIVGYKSASLNAKEREYMYYNAIKFYIEKSDFNTIIFCENSNYKSELIDSLTKSAIKNGKNLELLSFLGNPLYPKKFGYGAGEAEIFDYVYEHSKYIHLTDCWFKITGRYIINNINSIIKKLDSQDIYFQKTGVRTRWLTVSTAFFKINNKFFERYLYKKTLECFHSIFNCKNFNIKNFTKYPYISLEYVFYWLLRSYLIKDYTTKSYIPTDDGRFSSKHPIIFKLGVAIGCLDYNWFHKIFDFLFYKKIYSELIKNEIYKG